MVLIEWDKALMNSLIKEVTSKQTSTCSSIHRSIVAKDFKIENPFGVLFQF